jgi:hypothetical protein
MNVIQNGIGNVRSRGDGYRHLELAGNEIGYGKSGEDNEKTICNGLNERTFCLFKIFHRSDFFSP